jgi:hypothetical protein
LVFRDAVFIYFEYSLSAPEVDTIEVTTQNFVFDGDNVDYTAFIP